MLTTFAPHLPFLPTLASHVLATYGDDPLTLSSMRIFVPNRRTARSLRESFLALTPKEALLLPMITPIGDQEEGIVTTASSHVLAPLEQQLLLTRLIQARLDYQGDAFTLAGSLMSLMDEAEREECQWENLRTIVPDFYAKHWQETLDFLTILTTHWPAILKEEQAITQTQAQIQHIQGMIHQWEASPPDSPVIIAGTTASIPVVRRLVAAALLLPKGEVILPGYDTGLPENHRLALEPTHLHYMMKRLLDTLNTPIVEKASTSHPMTPFLREALRPESVEPSALDALPSLPITRIDCAHPQEEAMVIALIIREVLETPDKTVMVVTHDRSLATRIKTQLLRWDIACDDSAGEPLTRSAQGRFLLAMLDAVSQRFAPGSLLALLKHPLCTLGMTRANVRHHTRTLERLHLRGLRRYRSLNELSDQLKRRGEEELSVFIGTLDHHMTPLIQAFAYQYMPVERLLRIHIQAAEQLAEDLYQGDYGASLSGWLESLFAYIYRLADITPTHYPALFGSMLAQAIYRPAYGMHPRITLLSPLEARLHNADCVILSGLNEGSWPGQEVAQPWMNRAMRRAFGLPAQEQTIGQSAHDFVGLLYQPAVYLTRSQTAEGSPTIPSRWLLKLQAQLDAMGQSDMFLGSVPYQQWAKALDASTQHTPIAPPSPRPSRAARPKELSVTGIEKLMRDPYSIYASKILQLRRLDPLDQELDASEFGNIVHDVLHQFLEHDRDDIGTLLALGEQAFTRLNTDPVITAFWLPRFERIARWFIANETERKRLFENTYCEQDGRYILDGLTISARADRIDITADGRAAIIDYKTGTPPTKPEIISGLASQLVVEAIMLEHEGFAFTGRTMEIAYWHLKGSDALPALIQHHRFSDEDIRTLIQEAKEGLRALAACFNDDTTPYLSIPDPSIAPRYNDYAHLARVKEWG